MSRPSSVERLGRLLADRAVGGRPRRAQDRRGLRRFGVSEPDLLADLKLIFLCGVYPFTPDALIEVDIDGGRVWIRFADWFRRPLRLTPPEGLALVAAARALLSVPGQGGTGADSALNSAVAKLEMVLGAGGDEALDIELGEASAEVLGVLGRACAQGRKVRVGYYSFGRDETGERVVRPWRLFSSEGQWYLLAWCESVGDKRLFRVDRVRSATALEGRFEPPAAVSSPPLLRGEPAGSARRPGPPPARSLDSRALPERGRRGHGRRARRVRLRVSSRAWLERLLLRAGTDATVVSGADGVAAVGSQAHSWPSTGM